MAYISMSMVPLSSFFLLNRATQGASTPLGLLVWEVCMVQHDALRKDGLCPLVIAIMGSGFLFGDFVVGHLGVLQMSTPQDENLVG